MNSKSKKFAGVQAYVTASAVAKNAQDALDKANAAVTAAEDAVTAQQKAFDEANAVTPPTPEQLADQAAAIADLEAAVTDAQTAAAAAQTAADTADDNIPSLDDALADMANKPVDAEVTDWANGVLAEKIDQAAAKMAPPETP